MKMKKRKKERKKKVVIYALLHIIDLQDLMVIFWQIDPTIKIKNVNEVLSGPSTMLIHFRHLRLISWHTRPNWIKKMNLRYSDEAKINYRVEMMVKKKVKGPI